jgi:hypothetical protein
MVFEVFAADFLGLHPHGLSKSEDTGREFEQERICIA